MTMSFRTLKTAVEGILVAAAAGRFRVIGYQDQGKAADEVIDTDRAVQVYFARGRFPKSGGSQMGPVKHDLTIKIEFTVGEAAEGDVATLANDASTPAQIVTALTAMQAATKRVDDSFDELADIVFQILNDNRNVDLGLSAGNVSNRWIAEISKNPANRIGEYVILTGEMDLTCTVSEAFTGDAGLAADPSAVQLDVGVYRVDSESTPDAGKAGVVGGD